MFHSLRQIEVEDIRRSAERFTPPDADLLFDQLVTVNIELHIPNPRALAMLGLNLDCSTLSHLRAERRRREEQGAGEDVLDVDRVKQPRRSDKNIK